MNYKLIQFILQQLKNNPEDRERFNKILRQKLSMWFSGQLLIDKPSASSYTLDELNYGYQESFIRTALSRTKDGKAVLSALEDKYKVARMKVTENGSQYEDYIWLTPIELKEKRGSYHIPPNSEARLILDLLYQAFDTLLRNGSTLKEALEACEKYFEEEEGVIRLKI